MKRIISLLLALMLIISLAACGENTTSDKKDKTDKTSDKTGNLDLTDKKEITFSETVVVDNDECFIKITEIDPDNMWGYTLEVQLENRSDDKTYMFSVRDTSINDVLCESFFASEITAGKKANESINFNIDTLEENGLGDVTDIELTFRVYDSEDWTADEVALETVHIYPYGEEMAETYVREEKDSDIILVDNEYVTAIVLGYEEDEIWGYTVNLFLVNKSDKDIMFGANEASINGYMADPYYGKMVNAGKSAFSSMSWSDSTLEENDITKIETIEFEFRAYDYNDYMSEDFVNEVITLNP